jgi:CRISPR type I-D-associated protein Csc2
MDAFGSVRPCLRDKPHPLIGAETVQLLLLREVLDYTVLRTEETRDLNTVQTPLSVTDPEPTRRVGFLATKQKAAESRQLEHLLRSARRAAGLDPVECYLKDSLCMRCPRCGLYGATSTVSGQSERANIKHRIEYSTAFSLVPFEEIAQSHTFNAINDSNETTGQALGSRNSVGPATLFPSVITLKSVTQRELILAVKTLLACKSYGAESRIGGDVRNHLVGVITGWEEIITALEFSLELYARQEELSSDSTVAMISAMLTEHYLPLAGNPGKVCILTPEQVAALTEACRTAELDRGFIEAAYGDIGDYRQAQGV